MQPSLMPAFFIYNNLSVNDWSRMSENQWANLPWLKCSKGDNTVHIECRQSSWILHPFQKSHRLCKCPIWTNTEKSQTTYFFNIADILLILLTSLTIGYTSDSILINKRYISVSIFVNKRSNDNMRRQWRNGFPEECWEYCGLRRKINEHWGIENCRCDKINHHN